MAKHDVKTSEETEQNDSVSVLIADEDELLRKSCSNILSSEGYTVHTEARGRSALDFVRRNRPDVVLTEFVLPDMDGVELIQEIKRMAPDTLVVVITSFIENSMQALNAGVHDYIPKPFTASQLRILIRRAAQQVRLARDNATLRGELERHYGLENVVGSSESLRKVLDTVARVASTDASVLISGENGTGKGLIARVLHASSRRASYPFKEINCAMFPLVLLEVELFGHEKGAFTGAGKQRRGLIEMASGGTLLLEEIFDMDPYLQAKLLEAIHGHKIRRVGGDTEIPIDVRWVSTTSRDPEQAIHEGTLRHDLLYRLNVIPLRLPPLRDRREDIPVLAQHFLQRYTQEYDRDDLRFTSEAIHVLSSYDWPQNVRELSNVVERVVSLSSSGQLITPADLPEEIEPFRAFAGSSGFGEREEITRSIEFPQEYYQAGVGILAYFGEVLRQKHPDVRAKVRIEQDGMLVRLQIESESGDREVIERTLQDYVLVVAQQVPPESLFDSKLQILALEQRLEMARMEIGHTRQLLALAQESYGRSVQALQDEVDHLRSYIGQQFLQFEKVHGLLVGQSAANEKLLLAHVSHADKLVKDIMRESRDNKMLHDALALIERKISQGATPDDEREVMQALTVIQKENPTIMARLQAVTANLAYEVGGSYLFKWIEAFAARF